MNTSKQGKEEKPSYVLSTILNITVKNTKCYKIRQILLLVFKISIFPEDLNIRRRRKKSMKSKLLSKTKSDVIHCQRTVNGG